MEQDRSFEKQYALHISRIKQGRYKDAFDIDAAFFTHFPKSLIDEGVVHIDLVLDRRASHMDARYTLKGHVMLPCDRCGELYSQRIDSSNRIIYAFDPDFRNEEVDVIYVEPDVAYQVIVQELYDFVNLAVPMRRIADPDVHMCAPEVLDLLGLDKYGNPKEEIEVEEDAGEEIVDDRWAALKALRDKMED